MKEYVIRIKGIKGKKGGGEKVIREAEKRESTITHNAIQVVKRQMTAIQWELSLIGISWAERVRNLPLVQHGYYCLRMVNVV